MTYYNKTNTCENCGKDLNRGDTYPRKDRKGQFATWNGNWLCRTCWGEKYGYAKKYYRDVQQDFFKSLRNRRIGNLDPNSTQAKGDLFEDLTCRWRGVKNLNIENNNFNFPIDHSRDIELGIIQTKGKLYDVGNRAWISRWIREHFKQFDYLIYYCASGDMKKIDRIYIFPKEEVIKRSSISIYKSPTNNFGKPMIPWSDTYRIKDESIINKVNDIWSQILKENGDGNRNSY